MTRRRVVTVDCQYLHPRFAAAYLLVDGDRAAFVDNNTAHSVPLLLAALKNEGLTPAQVDFVIITHVHLDHAGGTSQLIAACPNATLLAHPRAAKHMIDPAKLVASARRVYGDANFDKLYGRIDPIDALRVRVIEDETAVPFGQGAPLRFFHTRGHANHHFCVYEPETRSVFTGDSFGLAYPALQPPRGLFIFPTTSPTDFDGHEALATVDKIVATSATQAYPTHFGPVKDLAAAATQLKRHLTYSLHLLKEMEGEVTADTLEPEQLEAWAEARLRAHYDEATRELGMALTPQQWELLKLDLELNAQGLAHAARKALFPG